MLSVRIALAEHRGALACGYRLAPSGVRRNLTPARRRKRHRDNAEYGAMVLRIIRAYSRRVGNGDPEDLEAMFACRRELDSAIAAAITSARAALGWSWADVGRAANMTRQSAHERWGGHG